jgi:hypothetical protein
MIDILMIIPRALFYGEWIVIGLGVAAIAVLIIAVVIAERGK